MARTVLLALLAALLVAAVLAAPTPGCLLPEESPEETPDTKVQPDDSGPDGPNVPGAPATTAAASRTTAKVDGGGGTRPSASSTHAQSAGGVTRTTAVPAAGKMTTTSVTDRTTSAVNSSTTTGPGGNPPKVSPPSASPDDTTPRKAHWTDHPVYRASPDAVTPPIVAWYTTRNNDDEREIFVRGRYTQRGSRHNLMRASAQGTPDEKKLHNYDLLQVDYTGRQSRRDNYLDFETTRESQMCIVIAFRDGQFRPLPEAKAAGPPGFGTDVGMVAWDSSEPKPKNMEYADYTDEPLEAGYVTCRVLPAGVHMLPSADILGAQYDAYAYDLLFSEVDGSAPELSAMPPGWSGPDIVQHEKCPDELHEMWVVEGHDPGDEDIAGVMWNSWHPQVDYIYRCYYGHEHGTPGMLAGYTERFHYTAWKNDRQDETHPGFKTHVMDAGSYYVVVNLHSNTQDFARMNVDVHSMVVAVTDKTTGKLMSEMSCKSSSGGAGADYKDSARPPIGPGNEPPTLPMGNAASKQRLIDMYAAGANRVNVRKRVNLYNPDDLDPRLRYEGDAPGRTDLDNARGVYERWFMHAQGQYCMKSQDPADAGGPLVDIKNAQNGCKDVDCTQKIVLGGLTHRQKDGFVPNMGHDREINMIGLSIGAEHCDLELPEPNADGYRVWYTDPTCTQLCDGPGRTCVMQRMHTSFHGVSIDGKFATSDAHGHNIYFVEGDDADFFGNIAQVEGALGIQVERA
jgi:hypothetical protein